MQILKTEEEGAKPLAGCEEKRKDWAKHWQGGKEVPNQKNKKAMEHRGAEEVRGGLAEAHRK